MFLNFHDDMTRTGPIKRIVGRSVVNLYERSIDEVTIDFRQVIGKMKRETKVIKLVFDLIFSPFPTKTNKLRTNSKTFICISYVIPLKLGNNRKLERFMVEISLTSLSIVSVFGKRKVRDHISIIIDIFFFFALKVIKED